MERPTNFDLLLPQKDSAQKIGQIVTRSIEGLLFESKLDADDVVIPGVFYGTSRGVKYEYRELPGSLSFSYGPVDASANRRSTIMPGRRIEGTGLTHKDVMTAMMDHNVAVQAAAEATMNAKIMIGQIGLTDVREQFKELVNNPYVEAMAA